MAFGKSEPIRWYNFWVCFAISIGTLTFSYSSAVIGPTLGKVGFLTYMGIGDATGIYANSLSLTGAITGVFQAGAAIGAAANCYVVDKWGRKPAMYVAGAVALLGCIGMTASVNIGMFITFRFFSGAGAWAMLAVVPLYISELAAPVYRGFFGGMVGIQIGLGYSTASLFGLAGYYSPNAEASWRIPLGIAILWPLLILAIIPFVPESPRFLLMNDRQEEAWKIVSVLHRDPQDADQEFARREFYQMTLQAEQDHAAESGWLSFIHKRSHRKRALHAFILAIIIQSTAVLVINNYGPTFFAKLGFGARDRLILQSGRDCIALLGNFIGSLLLDTVGRRKLLLFGLGGCIVCLSIEAAMVGLYGTAGTNVAGLGVGVAALFVFLAFYATGLDVGSFVWISEIFPNHLRAKGATITTVTTALVSLIYLQVTPLAFANLGWRYFLVFAVISTAGFVWLYLTLVETNGLPLEEIAAKFGEKDEVAVFVKDVVLDHEKDQLFLQMSGQSTLQRVATEAQRKSTHAEVEKV